MILNSLKLQNFKNYLDSAFDFAPGINCVVGKNGMGKTNLLDAIHYLSMTKSALNASDQQNISYDHPYFAINSSFGGDHLTVNIYFEKGKKKIIKVAGKEPDKVSDHIGKIPCVLTTPDDNEIIKEGSESRRRLFDSVISQYDSIYLQNLMNYQKLLKQRNAFLKQNEGRRPINQALVDIYDNQLLSLNQAISQTRKTFLADFKKSFEENYKQIFSGSETPEIHYLTQCLAEDFDKQYRNALEKDLILQRTTMGCHKDDFAFRLNDKPIRKFGSQGQQKSFILALKLSEFDFLSQQKGFAPLLLLDDVFDKLDDERIAHLVTLLSDNRRFPQIFITDARAERTKTFFSHSEASYYEIGHGKLL